jgi:hypothetical protein
MRKTKWSQDFLNRVWTMESIDDEGQRAYIESYNHEQSTMQYFMKHNPDDLAHTYYPPNQAINIHNAFTGPNEKWEVRRNHFFEVKYLSQIFLLHAKEIRNSL